MTDASYDYASRSGVRPISWDEFHGLVKALVVAVAPWRPEVVLPVLRGGAYAGTLLAHLLQIEIYPVRLSRRQDDVTVRETPRWLVEPPAAVRGRRVLVVDEMCSSGQTLRMVKEQALALGAAEVRTATLYAHTWGADAVDYTGLITDELVMNPWDREVYRDSAFIFHPEYVAALAQQGVAADTSLLVPAPRLLAAKGM